MNKNDEYRANAAECERMAHFTRNASEKRTWLEMAESWLRLIQPSPPADVNRFDAIEPGGAGELRSRTSTDCQPLRTVNRFEKASSASQQAMYARRVGNSPHSEQKDRRRRQPCNAMRIVAPLPYKGQRMRIYHLFRDAPFDADHIELMSSAFEDVSKQLRLGRREDAIRDIVAKAILECAQRGIRDPIEMRKCARGVLQIA